jgi:hypothetical protein
MNLVKRDEHWWGWWAIWIVGIALFFGYLITEHPGCVSPSGQSQEAD